MKKAFTQFTSQLSFMCRELRASKEEILRRCDLCLEGQYPDANEDDRIASLIVVCEYAFDGDQSRHVFVKESSFIDWLIDSCPKFDKFNWFDAYTRIIGTKAIAFHFPCDANMESFLFVCGVEEKKEEPFGMISFGKKGGMFFYPKKQSEAEIESSNSLRAIRSYKLAVASLLYMDCFPECVVPGAPEYVKHPAHHKYKDQIDLSISPKIMQKGTHASPTAHYRSGHFRFLASDKFKNKRFQSVFVCHTFVNGQAETILSPEDASN